MQDSNTLVTLMIGSIESFWMMTVEAFMQKMQSNQTVALGMTSSTLWLYH